MAKISSEIILSRRQSISSNQLVSKLTLLILWCDKYNDQSLNTHTQTLQTFFGFWSIFLVSTASMASLAPRNSVSDEWSSRKVLKFATSQDFSGPRMVSVDQKGETGWGLQDSREVCAAVNDNFKRLNSKSWQTEIYWKLKVKYVQCLLCLCKWNGRLDEINQTPYSQQEV